MEAAITIQKCLQELGYNVKVDGDFGTNTANAVAQAFIDGYATVPCLALAHRAVTVIPIDELHQNAILVSDETGVPASYLKLVLELENHKLPGYYFTFTKSSSKYIGLGQFSRSTWASLMPEYAIDDYASDSYVALIAIARYYLDNKNQLKSVAAAGGYTDRVAYLAHQQGAAGAKYYLRTGTLKYPKQSKKSLDSHAMAYQSSSMYV